jgi:hypothetical protein
MLTKNRACGNPPGQGGFSGANAQRGKKLLIFNHEIRSAA